MGIFNKLKNIFKKEENYKEKDNFIDNENNIELDNKEDKIVIEKENVKVYERGLSKTRDNFVSKLINLTNKYSKITDEYFDELEEILIMADIGVNTRYLLWLISV